MIKVLTNGKKVNIDFKNDKVKDLFLKICDKAPKVTVDWKKFRELDQRGLFSDFTNEQLSMRFRSFNFRRNKICWYCGEEEATENNGCCRVCSEKVINCNKNYNSKRKLKEVEA